MSNTNSRDSAAPIGMLFMLLGVMLLAVSNTRGFYGGFRNYHDDYTKPFRWYGVPNSNMHEVRRVDAKDVTCGTMYKPGVTETDNHGISVALGWTVYGMGFEDYNVTESDAKAMIDKNCY